jgi:hypothetical protein
MHLRELKRVHEVELADLTRGMQKDIFLEPEKLFLQSRVSLSFKQ